MMDSVLRVTHDRVNPRFTTTTHFFKPPSVSTVQTVGVKEWDNSVWFDPYRNPNWKSKIANGVQVTSNLSAVRYHYRPSYGEVTLDRWDNGVYNRRVTAVGSVPDPFGSWTWPSGQVALNSASEAASVVFVKHYKQKVHKLRGLTVVAELRETVSGILRPAKAFRQGVSRLIDNMRRGHHLAYTRRMSRRALRDIVSGTWLEWSFGISPLISDISDGMTALRAIQQGRVKPIHIRGMAGRENIPQGSVVSTFGSNGITGIVNRLFSESAIVEYHGVLRKATPSADIPWNQTIGFTLDEVVPAVWEAIPWSWLFDYVTNISEILEVASFDVHNLSFLEKRSLVTGTVVQTDMIVSPLQVGGGLIIRQSARGGRFKARKVTKTREASASLVTPTIYIEHPFGDIKKILNMAAVADQLERAGDYIERLRKLRLGR